MDSDDDFDSLNSSEAFGDDDDQASSFGAGECVREGRETQEESN